MSLNSILFLLLLIVVSFQGASCIRFTSPHINDFDIYREVMGSNQIHHHKSPREIINSIEDQSNEVQSNDFRINHDTPSSPNPLHNSSPPSFKMTNSHASKSNDFVIFREVPSGPNSMDHPSPP
jgi:hypothetical protein